VNSIPALAILLLCFGMAERDGLVIVLGYGLTVVSALYIGVLVYLVLYAGMHHEQVIESVKHWFD
jgi:hypothetical protein